MAKEVSSINEISPVSQESAYIAFVPFNVGLEKRLRKTHFQNFTKSYKEGNPHLFRIAYMLEKTKKESLKEYFDEVEGQRIKDPGQAKKDEQLLVAHQIGAITAYAALTQEALAHEGKTLPQIPSSILGTWMHDMVAQFAREYGQINTLLEAGDDAAIDALANIERRRGYLGELGQFFNRESELKGAFDRYVGKDDYLLPEINKLTVVRGMYHVYSAFRTYFEIQGLNSLDHRNSQ